MNKMPEDLELLTKKISDLEQKERSLRQEKTKTEFGHAVGLGFRIGVELLSAVIVGGALGYVLDEVFGTKPWLMIIFLFFGGIAGVLNVYRLSKGDINS